MASSNKKKDGKLAPSEMSTCAPSSSGKSEISSASSATMSTAETIEMMNKKKNIELVLEEEPQMDQDSPMLGPDSPHADMCTESDATTYNLTGSRQSNHRGKNRRARDEERMMTFQEAKGHTTRDWSTSEEVARDKAQNLQAATGCAGSVGKSVYKTALQQADDDAIDCNVDEKVALCLAYDFSLARDKLWSRSGSLKRAANSGACCAKSFWDTPTSQEQSM